MRNSIYLLLSLIVMLSACREDESMTVTNTTSPDPAIIVGYEPIIAPLTSSVRGHVTNEHGENMPDIEVTLNTLSTRTNQFGHFFFTDVEMNANGTVVQINEAGYFQGSRRFYPKTGRESRVEIQLIPMNLVASFESNVGGKINAELGGSVEFMANAIVDGNKQLYDGIVHVAARWLDPTALVTVREMPGDLTGVDNELNEAVLETYGMMAVELRSPSGEHLQMALDKPATLSFPIPTELQANSPAEIPLWYFNEEHGIWAQDGSALLENNEYVGTVSHFSFWNLDVPFIPITFELITLDNEGNPLANLLVVFKRKNTSPVGHGYTDNEGYTTGLIPSREALELNIYSHCKELVYTSNIGPFDQAEEDLGSVTIPIPSNNVTAITIALENCDEDPVTNGLVIAQFDGVSIYEYTSGAPVTLNVSSCPATAEIAVTSYDFDNLGVTAMNTVPVGPPIDLETVSVCDDVLEADENTIRVFVDGVEHVFPITNVDVRPYGNDSTLIQSYFVWTEPSFYLNFLGSTVGANPQEGTSLINDTLGWSISSDDANIPYLVTEYGANPGDKIKGTLTAEMTNYFPDPDVTVNVQIAFHATRD